MGVPVWSADIVRHPLVVLRVLRSDGSEAPDMDSLFQEWMEEQLADAGLPAPSSVS